MNDKRRRTKEIFWTYVAAYSFLWALNRNILNTSKNETITTEAAIAKEQRVEAGAVVTHKEYGEGTIIKITDNKMYVDFDGKKRIFSFPDACPSGSPEEILWIFPDTDYDHF